MTKDTAMILLLFGSLLVMTNLLSYSYGSNSFTLTQDEPIVVTDKERTNGKTIYRLEREDRSFHYQFFYEHKNPFVLEVGDTLNLTECK